MEKHSTPWSQALFLICQKCGTKFATEISHDALRMDLRAMLKETDQNKEIRVISSGCLSICNPEEQAVAYVPVQGETEIYAFQGKDQTAILDQLKGFVKSKLK